MPPEKEGGSLYVSTSGPFVVSVEGVGRPMRIDALGLGMKADPMPPGLVALHRWLDSWAGIGLIEHGMARQDFDLSLTRYAGHWGATFYATGREHSLSQGFNWQARPWSAVEQAAWAALHKAAYGSANLTPVSWRVRCAKDQIDDFAPLKCSEKFPDVLDWGIPYEIVVLAPVVA